MAHFESNTDNLICVTKLDNLEILDINLASIVGFGFVLFFSLIIYVIEYNCNNCDSNFGSASDAFALSLSQSNSGPIILDPNVEAQVFFKGINFPTSMAFLGPDDLLVLEKNEGTVKRIVNGTLLKDPLLKVNVSSMGERGMLGIAVVKRDNENKPPYVFLYYTAIIPKLNTLDGKADYNSTTVRNRLVRYELSNDRLVNGKLIFEIDPRQKVIHNGGKMVVGPDNNLYLVTGEAYGHNPQTMQDFPNGRAGILRFTPDGDSVKNESGRSIMGDIDPLDKYYAYGIRNSFGIDFDPISGKLWDTENGPDFGDEINLVEPGFNSGWSTIQGFWTVENPALENTVLNPNPDNIANFGGRLKYSSPELAMHHDPIGITALTFIKSINYGKQYENDMLVGDFHNGNLYHFELTKDRTELNLKAPLQDRVANNKSDLEPYILGHGFGGITDIKIGPDGNAYILSLFGGGMPCNTEKPNSCIHYNLNGTESGTIFRIIPIKSS